MSIWKTPLTLDQLTEKSKGTLIEHVGIEYLEIGPDFLKARMPVDHRTKQPVGLLHGGASVVLSETLGSIAAGMCRPPDAKGIVGLEVNANHVRAVKDGWVIGIARPAHVGSATQVWEIKICNEREQLVCTSRLTVANIK